MTGEYMCSEASLPFARAARHSSGLGRESLAFAATGARVDFPRDSREHAPRGQLCKRLLHRYVGSASTPSWQSSEQRSPLQRHTAGSDSRRRDSIRPEIVKQPVSRSPAVHLCRRSILPQHAATLPIVAARSASLFAQQLASQMPSFDRCVFLGRVAGSSTRQRAEPANVTAPSVVNLKEPRHGN